MKNKGDGFYPDYVYDRKKCPSCEKKGVIKNQFCTLYGQKEYRCMYCKENFTESELNTAK